MSHYKKESFQKTMSRETVEEVLKYPIKALPDRGITKETCEHFGVRCLLSKDKKIEAVYFPSKKKGEVTGFKKRDLTLPKKHKYHFTSIGDVSVDCELFGQSEGPNGGKKTFITEGEYDCLAAFQVINKKHPAGTPKVMSISLGTPNAASHIGNNLKALEGFKEIVIAFDMDEATPEERKQKPPIKRGKEATEDVAQIVPNMKVATLPCNDPNQCLLDGLTDELYWALVAQAKDYQPTGLITVEDVIEAATKMPEWGRKWPWPSLDSLTYGRRDGEGIYVGAAVKAGKTEWLSQMVDYIINVEKKKVGLFKFEQPPAVTVRALAGKAAHKQFHNPEHAEKGYFTQEELTENVMKLTGKVEMFDVTFSSVTSGSVWDKMKPAIRHMVVVQGIKDIFIDPITQITDGLSASDTETELRRFSNELQGMSQDLGFFYYCFAHLKEPAQGKTHEEGGKIKVAQFRGSRSMAEKTKFMLGIRRNQTAEDIEIRSTSFFDLLLNSGFGKSGSFPVKYDGRTGVYLEPEEIIDEEF